MPVVEIPLARVHDRATFHDTFAAALGFPDFYGRNMDAWIDCLTYADEDDGMCSVDVPPGEVLTLSLLDFEAFRRRCPELAEALLDCSAFVNHRRLERGGRPILALSWHGTSTETPSSSQPAIETSSVRISRPTGGRDKRFPFDVLIDGDAVGSLLPGQSVTVSVEPGRHDIQAKMLWLGSRVLRFTAHPNAIADIEAGSFSGWRTPIDSFVTLFDRNQYLRIEDLATPGRIFTPAART